MPHIEYISKRFRDASLAIIYDANMILDEYAEMGYPNVTLRQLYYQFVGRDLFPEDRKWVRVPNTNKWRRDSNGTKNADPNYKWLGDIMNDARLAGYVNWNMMDDRTRRVEQLTSWDNPLQIMNAAHESYHIDRWENQEYRPEIWIEKDALTGVIGPVCKRLDVPFFACRGYVSQSSMWKASQRLIEHMNKEQIPYLFYMGDHDPSGVNMTDDIKNRLTIFLEYEGFELGLDWEFKRIALNMDQVRQFNPPSDPAKMSDSRSARYVDKYGDEAWELDALSPEVMGNLIRENISSITDVDNLNDSEEREHKGKSTIAKAIKKMNLEEE